MTNRDCGISVRPGDVLAGKYRVERVLGAGGMGVVVAAHHIQLDTKVAIKLLLPAMLDNAEAVARFANEARRAVKFTSEHVARVLDVGTLEKGAPYMVMEFLEGGDLSGWLKQRGALPVEQAVDFLLQACIAVADAHALGIVHRDLKPANMFCVRRSDGQLSIKVLDFGISKVTESAALRSDSPSSGMGMTRTTTVMGSPFYMSPEQMQSPKEVGPPSDIWALGVVLFELLTTRVPFEGEVYAEIAVKVATQPPLHVSQLRPEVPAALEAAIEKCLERDPRRRHAHVGQLASAIARFGSTRARASVDRIHGILHAAGLSDSTRDASSGPIHETAFAPETHDTASTPETIAPVGGTAPGLPKRSKAAFGVAAGVAALVVAGAAVKVASSPHVELRSGEGPAAASFSEVGASQSSPAPARPVPVATPPQLSPPPAHVDLVPAPDPGAGFTGMDAGAASSLAVIRERLYAKPAHAHATQRAPAAVSSVAASEPVPAESQPPPSPPNDEDPLAKLKPK